MSAPTRFVIASAILFTAVSLVRAQDTPPDPPPDPYVPAPPCGAPGTPCAGASEPTSQSSSVSTGAGNPINVVTGNKYLHETDLDWSQGDLGLSFSRHYNSQSQYGRALSPGWSHSYEAVLTRFGADAQSARIELIQGDGRKVKFEVGAQRGRFQSYVSSPRGYGVIEEDIDAVTKLQSRQTTDALPWRWTWPDGRTVSFNSRGLVATIADPNGDQLRLGYDDEARLIQVRDNSGRSIRFDYWPRGVAQLKEFDASSSAREVHGRSGSLKSLHLADGSLIQYGYDAQGALTRVTYPDGTRIEYDYEEHGGLRRLTQVTGRDGRPRALYAYDNAGRAVSSSQPGGVNAVKLQYRMYDGKANIGETRLTNSRGDITLYRWTPSGKSGEPQLLEAIGPGCASCPQSNVRYSYDANGRVVRIEHLAQSERVESPIQRVALRSADRGSGLPVPGRVLGADRYAYDTQGRLLTHHQEIDGTDRLIERRSYATNLANPTRIERPSVVRGKMKALDITYNVRGQPVRIAEEGFSPRWSEAKEATATRIEAVTLLSYYEAGDGAAAPIGKLKSIDGPAPGTGDKIELAYTTQRLLARVLYPEGVSDQYVYDDWGRLIERTPEDGVQRRFTYLANSQHYLPTPLPNTASRGTLVTKLKTTYTGQLESYETPSGQRLTMTYDDAHRLQRIVDVQGSETRFEYDTEGNQTAFANATTAIEDGHRIERVLQASYDSYRRLTSVMGNASDTTEFDYGSDGRLQQTTSARTNDAVGNAFAPTQTADNPVFLESLSADFSALDSQSERDSPSARSGLRPMAAARAALRGEFDGAFSSRDPAWSSFVGPNNEVSWVLTDDFGRVVREDSNDAGWLQYEYGTHDDPVRICRSNGTCDEFTYDALGRPRTRTARDASGNTIVSSATYRGVYLIGVTNPSQTSAYQFDSHGRMIGRVDSMPTGTYRWSWTFDTRGRLSARGLPGGSTLHVRYTPSSPYPSAIEFEDTNGSMRTVVGNIRFNTVEAIAQFEYGNGLQKRLSHDAAGRLVAVTISRPGQAKRNVFAAIATANAAPAQVIWQQRFKYDAASQLSAMSVDGRQAEVDYDSFGRLSVIRDAIAAAAVEYDAGGNVTSWARAGRAARFDYQPFSNRIARTPEGEVAHDHSGNVTGIDGLKLTYSADNRVQSVRNSLGHVQRYEYNAIGERTYASASASTAARYFLYDASKVAAELRDDGSIAAHYVYLGDEPVAKIEPAIETGWFERIASKLSARFAPDALIHFVHGDHLGTPQLATDEEQRVAWQIQHDAYGNGQIAPGSTLELNLRFAGQYFDAASGLHYNYQRYYAPTVARYLQPDPIGIAAGFNVYQYASADPLMNVDPRGESIVSWLGKRAGMTIVQREIRRYMRNFAQSRIGSIVRRWADRGMNLADQFEEAQEIMRILDGASGIGVWDVVGLIPVIGDAVDIGRSVRQLCRIKDLMKRLDRKLLGFDRLPVNGGAWSRGVPGNGSWLPDANSPAWRATGGRPIQYRDGFPDFTPFTFVDARGRRGLANIQLSGDSARDIQNARNYMRNRYPDWVEPPNHTWHHDTQCGRMILVATVINAIPHAGGDAIHRQGLCD